LAVRTGAEDLPLVPGRFRRRALDEASVEVIDRRQGAVKVKYLDFDWALNRR